MSDTASKMPARIWITAEDRSASWAGSFTRWHASDLDHGDEYPVYYRADIFERLAEALHVARDAVIQSFDHVQNRDDQLIADARLNQIDSAFNSYREASNDKA